MSSNIRFFYYIDINIDIIIIYNNTYCLLILPIDPKEYLDGLQLRWSSSMTHRNSVQSRRRQLSKLQTISLVA